ncbi:MAG: GNAT family N-acetyltransferase [Clostridia bacterium]|nr:GNAT family N-acetyltransferase [Clostridia bacterium]
MKIVPYTVERIPDVIDFEARLRGEEPFFSWDIVEKYQADVKRSFSDPRFDGCISLLAEVDGEIVGRIDCTLLPSRFDGSVKAYLDWICVIRSHRHKGVAQSLMNALRAELRARNIDTLVALIAANDEAQRFYRSLEGAEIRDEGMWMTP